MVGQHPILADPDGGRKDVPCNECLSGAIGVSVGGFFTKKMKKRTMHSATPVIFFSSLF